MCALLWPPNGRDVVRRVSASMAFWVRDLDTVGVFALGDLLILVVQSTVSAWNILGISHGAGRQQIIDHVPAANNHDGA